MIRVTDYNFIKMNNDNYLSFRNWQEFLEEITDYQPKGKLILLSGRAATYKTFFMMNAALSFAKTYHIPVAMFSMEMVNLQIFKRLVMIDSGISRKFYENKEFTSEEENKLMESVSTISHLPIYIDDTSALGVLELEKKCKNLCEETGVKIIFIDYLNLMKGFLPCSQRCQMEIIKRMKKLAESLGITVFVIMRLKRDYYQINDMFPSIPLPKDAYHIFDTSIVFQLETFSGCSFEMFDDVKLQISIKTTKEVVTSMLMNDSGKMEFLQIQR